jgi:16S rRNA (uracil1498-N3)-methyltransferase
MAERFYVNCPLGVGPVALQGPEAHHLATVCRLRPGDLVCLFNGDGHEYEAMVQEVARQSVALQVQAVASPPRELGVRLEVAAPLPKGDRAQFLIEKLTELGVTTYVPLRTRRSVVHPGEGKREKLHRYVIEASKQCGRNVLLHLEPLTDWDGYAKRADLPAVRVLAHPGGADLIELQGLDLAVAVGPEGGFTDEEVDFAWRAGWQIVGLGPRILRVETAALTLAAWASSSPRLYRSGPS